MKRYIKSSILPGKYNIDVPYGNLRYSVCQSDGVPRYIYLHGISVNPSSRGQGIGTELLQKLISISDQYKLPIELQVAPILDSPMSVDDLKLWYSQNGFVVEHGSSMIYYPKYT